MHPVSCIPCTSITSLLSAHLLSSFLSLSAGFFLLPPPPPPPALVFYLIQQGFSARHAMISLSLATTLRVQLSPSERVLGFCFPGHLQHIIRSQRSRLHTSAPIRPSSHGCEFSFTHWSPWSRDSRRRIRRSANFLSPDVTTLPFCVVENNINIHLQHGNITEALLYSCLGFDHFSLTVPLYSPTKSKIKNLIISMGNNPFWLCHLKSVV